MKFCDTNEYSITIKDYKVVSYEVIGINTHPYEHEKELIDLENVYFDIYNFTSPNGRVHNLEFTNVKADLFSKNEKQFLYIVKIFCENGTHGKLATKIAMGKTKHYYNGDIDVTFKIEPIVC